MSILDGLESRRAPPAHGIPNAVRSRALDRRGGDDRPRPGQFESVPAQVISMISVASYTAA